MVDGTYASYVAQKALGPWFSAWAIRRRWQLDYNLSVRARSVRWAIVATGYSMTLTPGTELWVVRVCGGFTGLGFLCWPNFAYHLTKVFEDWPTAEGTVGSSEVQSASRWIIRYDFEYGGERYGGSSKMKAIPGLAVKVAYPDGASATIRYDPLNPGNSAVVEQSYLPRVGIAVESEHESRTG
ncbi:MAG: DUF3592 domain-containing protein [Acidobacteriota bacterium]|nr:DUF3592 domain-containing protein [Acidobacteriota bacterium]